MKSSLVAAVTVLALFAGQAVAQLENTVVELDVTGITIPASANSVVVGIFLPGNAADPMGLTPPNGDLVFIGGNSTHSSQGFLASAGCGLTSPLSPSDIGFFDSTFLLAVNDTGGSTVLSQGDATFVDDASGLACIVADPNGDGLNDDAEHADNNYYREFSTSTAGDIEVGSILVGVEAATEGNNPLGVDSDGDGIGDSEPILDGCIPVTLNFYFDTPATSIVVDTLGSITPPNASFETGIIVGKKNEDCLLGDVNLDGVTDILDVAPFVDAITTGTFSCEADVNEDMVVDILDVAPFVAILTGG